MTTETVTPDVAELAGRLQAQTNRAVLAEAKLNRLTDAMEKNVGWTQKLVMALVEARLPVPPRPHAPQEPLIITSADGRLTLQAPNGLVVFEDGPALERVIMQLIDQAREAFPETFTEVF